MGSWRVCGGLIAQAERRIDQDLGPMSAMPMSAIMVFDPSLYLT